jgi:hypothetical protein
MIVIQFLSAFLTPLVAIVTTYIAVQQWRLARRRWRLDLYDKRFETYQAVMTFIGNMCLYGTCTDEERLTFYRRAARNRFLFDPDIQKYIDELNTKALEKAHLEQSIQNEMADPSGGVRGVLAKQSGEISHWFVGQFDVAINRFGEYLEIRVR